MDKSKVIVMIFALVHRKDQWWLTEKEIILGKLVL